MSQTIPVGSLAAEVMKQLDDYAELTTEGMKKAVNDARKTVKKEIQANAPVKSGKYAKSWTVKKTDESSTKLGVTVHSKNRYQMAHLLEHGFWSTVMRSGTEGVLLPNRISLRQRKSVSNSWRKT